MQAGVVPRMQTAPQELQSLLRRSGQQYYAEVRLVSQRGHHMPVIHLTPARLAGMQWCYMWHVCDNTRLCTLSAGHVQGEQRRQVWQSESMQPGSRKQQRQEAHLLPGAPVRQGAVNSIQVCVLNSMGMHLEGLGNVQV
jgi:hypothetical protein